MKKLFTVLAILSVTLVMSTAVYATNGDNLIAVGPIARSMGGVGIAEPLDAISAVFANPAAMCFGKYCPASEINFAGTAFMPKIDAKIVNSGAVKGGTYTAESEDNVYPIPAFGLSVPIGDGVSRWRFGLAAYGVTGLGVDYRGTALEDTYPPLFGSAPLVTGEYTQLNIMKFAPAFSYLATPELSLGLAFHISYGNLDLRNGSSTGYAFGLQPGIIYRPVPKLALGLTYTSAQKISHENVADFDQDGIWDTLDLESPQQAGFGVAYEFGDSGVLVETDVKWLNWSDAEGYKDFDWNDQWVFSVGTRYEATEKLSLRAGYNYGKNPVEEHNNFNGTIPKSVQGKSMPTYYYETFRIIGFPAIVEHHLTFGVGYAFTDDFILDIGYMYAFENTITETGTDFAGQPVMIESTLSESSIDFGLTWRF